MVNCNPETVSTDYDTSDRLYFEPLDGGACSRSASASSRSASCIQFGGQTPLKLARAIERAGFRDPRHAVRRDRPRRGPRALRRLCSPSSASAARSGGSRETADEAVAIAERIGYPVLVRPSYVLGGRAMRVCYRPEDGARARSPRPRGPVLVDRFLENAIEIDVDALCDGDETYVARGDGARRGGRRPLRRLVVRAAGAVARRRAGRGDRGARAPARAGARRRRPR